MERQGGVPVSEESIARRIAARWGLAGGTNLVQAGLLVVLVLLLLGIAGGWWVGGKLASGAAAQDQLKDQREATAQAVEQLGNYQQAMATASEQREAMVADFRQIREEWNRDRDQDRRQQALINQELERALAKRPDLADVRVGLDVLQAWNDANRGRASGSASADAAAGAHSGRSAPAVSAATSTGQGRQAAHPASQPRRGGGSDVP
ncbi:MAG: hypothetical protein Q4G71_10085 [Pseudomonadota bacterium]|nr:hypothetical protein [Pseudomonadota bacterium]